MPKNSHLILPLLCILGLGVTSVQADTGIETISSASVWGNPDNQSWSLGWGFGVNSSVTISALGYNYFNQSLNQSHQVGVYDSLGNLLAQTVVDNSSTADNGFLYTSLTSSLTLSSGNYYIVGTTQGSGDKWTYDVGSYTMSPDITYLGSFMAALPTGYATPTSTVLFPNNSQPSREYFVANFQTTPVPLPASIWLFGAALAGLRGFARKARLLKA